MTLGKDGKATQSAVAQTFNTALPVWKQVMNGTTIRRLQRYLWSDPPKAYGFGDNWKGILASFMIPPDGSFMCS